MQVLQWQFVKILFAQRLTKILVWVVPRMECCKPPGQSEHIIHQLYPLLILAHIQSNHGVCRKLCPSRNLIFDFVPLLAPAFGAVH